MTLMQVRDAYPAITRRLFNVSFPRSGHHFVEEALRRYFGPSFAYCGFYDHCSSTPCAAPETVFQKNHDLWLDTPILEGESYLILLRHPYPALQSYFDLYLEYGWLPEELDTLEVWRDWLGFGLVYWLRLLRRWVLGGPPGRFVLSYEDLASSPHSALGAIVRLMAPAHLPALGRLHDIVAALADRRQTPGDHAIRQATAKPFTPRRIEAFRYYDPGELARIEDLIVAFANDPVAGAGDFGARLLQMIRVPLARPPAAERIVAPSPERQPCDPGKCFVHFPEREACHAFVRALAAVRPSFMSAVEHGTIHHLLPLLHLPRALIDGRMEDLAGLLGARIIRPTAAGAEDAVACGCRHG